MIRPTRAARMRRVMPTMLGAIVALALSSRSARAQASAAPVTSLAFSAGAERRVLAAARATSVPTIDGRLDDAVWRTEVVGRDFV